MPLGPRVSPTFVATPYFLGIKVYAPYIWAGGEVEFVYPETVLYRDGI